MKVAVVDYNQAHLDEAQRELSSSNVHFIRADVAYRGQVREWGNACTTSPGY